LRVAAGVLVVSAGLAGCGVPLAGPPHPLAGLPTAPHARPAHLIVVVEENHSFEQIVGSPSAPFFNELARRGTLLTEFYAITHPSLPNYVALLSGHTDRIESNCHGCTLGGRTLVDQLEARHISWAAYLEGLPAPCSTVAGAGAYTEAVDPFMHAARIRDDPARCDRVQPFSRFGADLDAGRLPAVAFVAPNLHDDMHSRPVPAADAWLRRLVERLETNRVWRQDTRVVVTFDESVRADTRSCCGGLAHGGRIPTVVFGPRVAAGRDATNFTHYSLLRSIEAAFGLPFLGHAGDRGTATIPAVSGRTR
jgi:hypothetical protein